MSLRPVRSRRHRFSYRQRASLNSQWQSHWNWKPSRKNLLGLFGKKSFVIALSLLIILIGGLVMYSDANNPLFHSISLKNSDPATVIWTANDPDSNLDEFSTYGNVVSDCLTASGPCGPFTTNGHMIKMDTSQSGTTTLIALTKSVIGDLSILSGKGLQLELDWGAAGANFVNP